MSWLFSRALVEEYSADTCLDGELSAPSNSTVTPQAYLPQDRMTEFSRPSQFGMTFAPLTESRGAELLTSFLEAFRARTSAQQEKVQASTESEAGSGVKWPESLVKYDRNSLSWRTHRSLWDEELPWSSVTLPALGMTQNGVVYQHPTAERPITGIDSGLSPDGKTFFHTPNCTGLDGGSNSRKALKAKGGEVIGQLNPTWVEWLMGWPLGWTDLKPLGMDRFQEWRQQHGHF